MCLFHTHNQRVCKLVLICLRFGFSNALLLFNTLSSSEIHINTFAKACLQFPTLASSKRNILMSCNVGTCDLPKMYTCYLDLHMAVMFVSEIIYACTLFLLLNCHAFAYISGKSLMPMLHIVGNVDQNKLSYF